MHKLLTSLAAVAALTLFASAGQACSFHDNVSASVPSEEVVAMSTASGTATPAPATTECPAGQTCAPAGK